MTISVAFFLSDMGDLIHVPDSHIATVIGDPQRFGFILHEIQAAYSRHGERIGVEGDARKEILHQFVAGGWIRLRRCPNRQWSLTVHSLTPGVTELLREWATQMLSGINGYKDRIGTRP